MSIYNPLSSSFDPNLFLDYRLFNVTNSIAVSSSERTPTSSAQLTSGSIFLLSASAAYTAGLNVQTQVILNSYVYNSIYDEVNDPSGALHYIAPDDTEFQTNTSINTGYGSSNIAIGQLSSTNVASFIEGPIRITTGSDASKTTGSIRIEEGRVLRIKDGENFTIKLGCTSPNAFNYDPSANTDDGSCILPILGCTNPNSSNYNPLANVDDGSCVIAGCTDPTAVNYNPLASTDNGTCQYVSAGTFVNSNPSITHVDNSYLNTGVSIGGGTATVSANNPTLNTNGSILMRMDGTSYNGPYHLTTYNSAGAVFKQIYVIGPTPSNRPTTFIDENITYLRNGDRIYADNNEPMSRLLPAAYKQPVSQEQLCSNCAFWKPGENLNCSRWKAKVRANYWCAKYKPMDVLTPAGDTFRADIPGVVQTGLTTSGNEFLLANRNFYIGSYRIMPDGTYFADDVLPFRRLTLKQTLKFGPNRHFTKINKNIQVRTVTTTAPLPSTTQTTQTTQTTPTYNPPPTTTTSAPATSTGGAGTSYSY